MTWEDPAGDPVPPGHGEHGRDQYGDEGIIPFTGSGPAWRPAQLKEEIAFGVPLCPGCHYFHHPEEGCRR